MHRILSLAVAAGLLLAPSAVLAQPQKEETFQFVKKKPAVGDTDTTAMRVELRMRFILSGPAVEDPQPVELSSVSSDQCTQTVLSVRKGLIDRVKVVFGETYEESEEEGKTTRKDSPVSGKTYVAALVKGRTVVTDEAGKPVSKEEQAAVKDKVQELGKVDPLEAALPDKPIRVGDSLENFAKVFTREVLDQKDPSTRFHGTHVRLEGITQDSRGAVGAFRMSTTLTIQEADAPFVMTIPLEGTLSILDQGTQVLEFTLAGPVKATVAEALREQGVTMDGEGQMKLHLTSPGRQ